MAEGAVANTVNWAGHAFYVLSMEADWNDEPGVYIFAGIQADALWHAYYVGITESFKAGRAAADRAGADRDLSALPEHAPRLERAAEHRVTDCRLTVLRLVDMSRRARASSRG